MWQAIAKLGINQTQVAESHVVLAGIDGLQQITETMGLLCHAVPEDLAPAFHSSQVLRPLVSSSVSAVPSIALKAVEAVCGKAATVFTAALASIYVRRSPRPIKPDRDATFRVFMASAKRSSKTAVPHQFNAL